MKEKEPKSLTETAELADTYYALGRVNGGREVQRGPHLQGQPLTEAVSRNLLRLSPGPPERKGRNQTNQHGEKRFQCNRFGHMLYNCPYKKETITAA